MEKVYLHLSVHQLVDFLFRTGDIDDRVYNASTMAMGSKLHSAYQQKQGNSYQSEYPLDGKIEVEEGTIFLQGRADGIIIGEDTTCIDEIKTCIIPVQQFYDDQKKWHISQALTYAYLYLQGHDEPKIDVALTYISQIDPDDKMVKRFSYSKEDVIAEVEGYARQYLEFYQSQFDHLSKRDQSVKTVPFPYTRFRKGQKELATYAYKAIVNNSTLFVEAPTGIGKTLSFLYPAVKSYESHRVDRIFYFTAKQTGSLAAYDAFSSLYEAGLIARDSTLIAKEKICMCPGCRCNPKSCPYAEGYYTKIKDALGYIMSRTNRFDELAVIEAANHFTICPFEMQLDLSLFADAIICDYNYLLDPMVYLERYFDEGADASTSVFLFDEAHNLIDRCKDMYGASLDINVALQAKKALKGTGWKKTRKAITNFVELCSTLPFEYQTTTIDCPKEALLSKIDAIKRARTSEEEIDTEMPETASSFLRDLSKFKLILEEYYNEAYVCYTQIKGESMLLKLHCVDASKFVKERMMLGKARMLFSATLSPMDYIQETILGEKNYPSLLLPSPFKKEQMGLFVVPNISIKYKDRSLSYEPVGRLLSTYVNSKMGNYFLFFPSYEYLENVRDYLDLEDADVIMQERSTSAKERKQMLDAFLPNPMKTTVGCFILGGAFAEGVDLVSDRLIGVGLVGVGMPQINFESDLVRSYYEEKEGTGFNYAYVYPGLNKVAQAIGRLIRSEEDRGTALLIDDRYRYGEYRGLLGRLLGDPRFIRDEEELLDCLTAFYHSSL